MKFHGDLARLESELSRSIPIPRVSKEMSDMDRGQKIGVLGAGMMGAEIALCFAMSKYSVVMKEVNLEMANQGKQRLVGVLDRAIKKGKFPAEDKEATLGRIEPTDQYEHFQEVDLVVEAIIEDFSLKKMVLDDVDKICKPECVFADEYFQHTHHAFSKLCAALPKGEIPGCPFLFPSIGDAVGGGDTWAGDLR